MKILVVDDEALIRESIITLLSNMGITDTEEARDGIEALEIIQQSKPNIVIADIRMPGMDGLSLLSRVKEMKWDVLFIFVSGYDLFEYAQKAMRLGAFGYLLKPIKENELKTILDQACETLFDHQEQQQVISRMELTMNQGKHFMRKHFLLDLMKDNTFTDKYIQEKFNQLDIHFPENHFTVLYISADDYNTLLADLSLKEKELIKFSLENIVLELLSTYAVIAYSFGLEDGLGIVLNYANHNPVAEQTQMVGMCVEINRCIAKFTKITTTIGIGSKTDHYSNLKQSYEAAQQAVMHRMVQGNNRVILLNKSTPETKIFNTISLKKEQELVSCFEQCDQASAPRLIEELFSPYKDADHVDVNSLMKLYFQLIMLMFKTLNMLNINPEEALGDEFKLYNQVKSYSSIYAAIDWFTKKLEVCFELIRSKKDHNNTNLIEKAKEYIKRNFNKEITLESLADHVHLSPPYLSKLFKEEVGENFSAYLMDYRMNAARSLLKEGIYKANQVAEMVGFHNEKYFFKVFKKQTGFTPSEYKNL